MGIEIQMADPLPTIRPPSDWTLATEPRTKVKFCGMTNRRDVETAVRFFADAVGFVFAPESPRRVDLAQAAELSRVAAESSRGRANGTIGRFGVFVNAPADEVLVAAERAGLTAVQLHGEETPGQVAEIVAAAGEVKVVKAVRVSGPESIAALADYPDCWAYLLDAHVPGRRGGTGQTFNWDLAAEAAAEHRIVLAGGLTPNNVGQAIAAVHPFMVDVSSGVEERPRRKDHNFMLSLMGAVRRAGLPNASQAADEPGT